MKKIYLRLALLFSLIILFGCRTEQELNVTEQKNIISKIISLKDVKDENARNTILQIKSTVYKDLSGKYFPRNLSYKKNAENDPKYDFNGAYILEDNIVEITNELGIKTYTIPISRFLTKDIGLQNIVLIPNKGVYKAYLFKYNVNESERNDLINGPIPDIENKTDVFLLNQKSKGTSRIASDDYNVSTMEYNDGCVTIIFTRHEVKCECSGGSSWTNVEVYDNCAGSGSGGGGGGGGGGQNDGGTGGGPGGGGNGSGNTRPVDPGLSVPPTCQTSNCNEILYANEINNIFIKKFNIDQLTFLFEHKDVAEYLYNKLSVNPNIYSFETVVFGIKFLEDNTDTLQPEKIFERVNALNNLLLQNPDALLDIPCKQLPFWKEVAEHKIPQSVKTKLQNIKNQTSLWSNWEITSIDDASGPTLNMDLFPVKITEMPEKSKGVKYTPAEFFDYFRKNINLFAEKFTPIEDNYYNIHDTSLWNSANPLGALIHITIPVDDGTVVCSGVSSNTWIFSTIKAPLSWKYDGIHPVAGNRVFSYNMSGNIMTIYTRGVDRMSTINHQKTPFINYLMEVVTFSGADDLWTGMQKKLAAEIVKKGGKANVEEPQKYRRRYAEVIDYLKNKSPITILGCK